jgi:hypothetical protein
MMVVVVSTAAVYGGPRLEPSIEPGPAGESVNVCGGGGALLAQAARAID